MAGPAMIAFARCADCGAIDSPSRSVCGKCLGARFDSVMIAGAGTLASWTTVRKPPLRFRDQGPYHVGVFDLDQGLRVTGRLVFQGDARIGDRVVAIPAADGSLSAPTFTLEKKA